MAWDEPPGIPKIIVYPERRHRRYTGHLRCIACEVLGAARCVC